MTLDQLIDTFIQSHRDDWHRTSCWGTGSGPSYRDHFAFQNIYRGESNVITHQSHGEVASYKKDLCITIAWGLEPDSDDEERTKITEDWTQNFPDKSGGRLYWLDFFYNSALVLRVDYVAVDGGRYYLPYPTHGPNGNRVVPQRYSDVVKKLSEIVGDDYDMGIRISRIETTEEEWP